MSYGAVQDVLDEQGIGLDQATDDQLYRAYITGFKRDLPLGFNHLLKLAATYTASGTRILNIQQPGTPLGQQLIRLCGPDIPRAFMERRMSEVSGRPVYLGFYNCCAPVVAGSRQELGINPVEQLKLQNGALASDDC